MDYNEKLITSVMGFDFAVSVKDQDNQLVKQGINKVIQKVGEEAVELVIEAKDDNEDLFKNEAADLLYHFLILLKVKNIKLENVEQILSLRSKKSRG